MSKVNRRKFMQGIGTTTGTALFSQALMQMGASILAGSNQALGQEKNPRRMVSLFFPGAPARWMFNLFLTPYSTRNFMANTMVGTRFEAENGRYTKAVYDTVEKHGMNVPYIWDLDLPQAGGGTRPMSDLLPHMLALQGINTGNAGHPGSQAFHWRPSGATQSLTALSADASMTPFSAINTFGNNMIFLSRENKSQVVLGGRGNLLDRLLAPFDHNISNAQRTKQQILETLMQRATDRLNQAHKSKAKGVETLVENNQQTVDLLQRGFGGIDAFWNTNLQKYENLIRRTIAQNLPGINDRPIGKQNPGNEASHLINRNGNRLPDMRTMIDNNSTIPSLAAQFVVAEYVLTTELSRSVVMRVLPIRNTINHDQHNSGSLATIYFNTLLYRAVSACTLELVDQLKAKGIWKDTVIEMASEFNRSPKFADGGSDHGWQGKSVTYFSGAINNPLILGPIRRTLNNKYRGTWGVGANSSSLGGVMQNAHAIASLAYLLRVPSPITSTNSLVYFDGGELKSTVERTEIRG